MWPLQDLRKKAVVVGFVVGKQKGVDGGGGSARGNGGVVMELVRVLAMVR